MSTRCSFNSVTKLLYVRFDDMKGQFVVHIDENGLRSGKKGDEICEWKAYLIHVVYEPNLLRVFTEDEVKAEGLRMQYPLNREEYNAFQQWMAERDLFSFCCLLEEAIDKFLDAKEVKRFRAEPC